MSNETIINAFIDNVEKLYSLNPDVPGQDGFSVQFQDIKQQSANLKQSPNFRSTAGELADNKKKNRYKDILPFDTSRVKLLPTEDSSSDYINASFIDGPEGKRSYIASQGPLPHTVDDFWRMLWDNKVKVVVMVCREIELGKRKCERYWPAETETKNFGDITVGLLSSEDLGSGINRRRMHAQKGKESIEVTQLHYKTWPDHGTPRAKEEILRLIDEARNIQDYSKDTTAPLCVHCSAGCGRTGAVLAIDYFRYLLHHKKLTNNISVYDIIIKMRRQRPAIVQTKEQYEFVHLAISQLFTMYVVGSGNVASSNLSRSLLSTDYENVTLKEPPKPHKVSKPPEGMALSAPRNNYENITLEKPVTAKRPPLPGNLPSKPLNHSLPHNPPPKPLNPPPKPHNFASKPGRVDQSPGVTSVKPDLPTGGPMVSNLHHGKPQASRQHSDPKTSKPLAAPLYSNNLAGYPAKSSFSSGLDQKPPPSNQKPKPRPRLALSNLPESNTPSARAQTNENPKFVITESLQARKNRLLSHGFHNETPLQRKPEVSASVSDLRFINHSPPSFLKRRLGRPVSVDLEICKNSNNNNSNNNNNNNFEMLSKKTDSNQRTPNKALMPPVKKKPPVLPRKFGSMKNIDRASEEVKTDAAVSNENKPAYVNTSKPDDKLAPGYINVTSSSNSVANGDSYTHISVNHKTRTTSYDTYDVFKRSIRSASNAEVKENPNNNNNESPFPDRRVSDSSALYSTVDVIKSPKTSSNDQVQFRSSCTSTGSGVFESSSNTEDPPGLYSSVTDLRSTGVQQEQSKPADPSKPPLKPKRTFKKKHNPYLQKGYSEESADRDLQADSSPYAEIGGLDDFNQGQRPRGYSGSSQRSNSSLSNEAGSFPNLSKPTFPPLPQRTPESYLLVEPDNNKYEEVNIERRSSHSSNDNRSSGSTPSGKGVKAKAKGVFDKTSNALHHLTNNNKDETHQLKSRQQHYVQEPVLWRDQDISYGNRVQRKPRGGRSPPKHR